MGSTTAKVEQYCIERLTTELNSVRPLRGLVSGSVFPVFFSKAIKKKFYIILKALNKNLAMTQTNQN